LYDAYVRTVTHPHPHVCTHPHPHVCTHKHTRAHANKRKLEIKMLQEIRGYVAEME